MSYSTHQHCVGFNSSASRSIPREEKGRLACFQLSTARGASEHSHSVARESEHVLNAAEVVDLRTLFLFLKQTKADMPHHLQEAIRRLGNFTADHFANAMHEARIRQTGNLSASDIHRFVIMLTDRTTMLIDCQ